MKYLKTFENKNLKYKQDDYVYIVGYPEFDNLAKVYMVNSKSKNRSWDYLVSGYDNTQEKILRTYVDQDDIERRLTDDEILEYDSRINADKYNL